MEIDTDETMPSMSESTLAFAVELFSALAHPARLKIVELLTDRERTVGEVAHDLGLLQPNVSQHLHILSRAGVVKATALGNTRCYSLRGPRIAQILILVNEFRHLHRDDFDHTGADTPVGTSV